MFRSNKTQGKNDPKATWYFSRIRIYDEYISMGFGGAEEQGFSVIENILGEITPKLGLPAPYNTYRDGGHLVVNNLSGFTRQIGWMIIGVLVGRGWFIQEFRQEGITSNLNMNIELIDIMRNL